MRDSDKLVDVCKGWYALATSAQRAEGTMWYPNARAFCEHVAAATDLAIEQVAGVVAALSPAVYWDLNKRQAEALCRAYSSGGEPLARKVVLSTYGRQAAKAYAILGLGVRGKPLVNDIAYLLGRRAFKTRAFFHNILENALFVCIDRHIVSALNFTDRWTTGAAWCYNLLVSAIMRAAAELNIPGYTLQAIIWVTFKAQADAYSKAEQGVQHEIRMEHSGDALSCPV